MGCSASKEVLVTIVQNTKGTCSSADNVVAPQPRSSTSARDSSKSSVSSSSSGKTSTKVASVNDNSYITAAILSTRLNSTKVPVPASRALSSSGRDKLMFSVRHENQQYQIKVKHKKSRVKHHEGTLPDPATSRSYGKKQAIRRSKCSSSDDHRAAEEAGLAMDLCRKNPSSIEVINTWELMQGLEDEDEAENPSVSKDHGSVSVLELQIPSSPIVQDSKRNDGSAVLSVMLPVKKAIRIQSDASNANLSTSEVVSDKPEIVSRKTRTKYLASTVVGDEDGNCEKQINGASSQVDSSFLQSNGDNVQSESDNKQFYNCENSLPETDMAVATPPHDSNLNRTLSFNYYLAETSFMDSRTSSDSSSLFTAVEEMSSSDCISEDSLVFITARVVNDGEEEEDEDEENCPSSPEFSTAASLKDWLPWDAKHGSKITDDVVDQNPTPNAHVNHQQSDSVTSSGNIEALVFDPDLVDSFEKAMEQLSKEEWDAVRNMEETPRKFVGSVGSMKSLRRTSSNNLHRRNMSAEDDIRTSSNGNGEEDFNPVASTSTITISGRTRKLQKSSEAADRRRPMIIRRQQSLDPRTQIKSIIAGEDGGTESVDVTFYSTTSQSDPEAYEQCNQVRDILRSLSGVSFDERSVSEKPEYSQMLKNSLRVSNAVVPTVYMKGKYIVGIDSILQLYRKGVFISLLKYSVSDRKLVD